MTIIYENGKDSSEVKRKLNYDFNNIVKWLDSNNSMQLNTSNNKTKFMLIHDPRKLSMNCCNIKIDGVHLEEV